jgi:hypothetical protein
MILRATSRAVCHVWTTKLMIGQDTGLYSFASRSFRSQGFCFMSPQSVLIQIHVGTQTAHRRVCRPRFRCWMRS